MRVFLNTDVLIDVAVRIDRYPHSFKMVNDLIDSSEFSPWISAISVNSIERIVSKLHSREKARSFLKLIREEMAIIPLRRSIFSRVAAHDDGDFDDEIQIASAEQFFMDYIVTRDVDAFRNGRITALTPVQFLEKWDRGEFDSVVNCPFMDLKAQHYHVYNEIDDRITDIIANTGFILGKHVEEFEKSFALAQGAKYCLCVSSGTAALHIALLTLGIGPGDSVIVPVNTFIATAEAASLAGATPVFADCDEYYNIDTAALRERMPVTRFETEYRPKAIIPVHLYGQPARMDEIMDLAEEYGLIVVEDCCQAHLACYGEKLVGNFGQFGAFSFYPGKNLGAYGEAGALITNDEDLYKKAKMIRQHGEIQRYHHNLIGHNCRMEAIQGAVLAAKLKYLDAWTQKRQENARLYNEMLEGIEGIETPEEIDRTFCVYHLYVIQANDRDGLKHYLDQNGVATGLHYPVPLHLQQAYSSLGYAEGDFPVAEKAAKRILSLPMYPELTKRHIRYVCDKIKEYAANSNK